MSTSWGKWWIGNSPSPRSSPSRDRHVHYVLYYVVFKELAAMMPIFKKANEELKGKVIEESEKIDAKLEMVEDSSSSSS